MEVPLNAEEYGYVEARIGSGRATSAGEVLRGALQFLMEQEAEGRREYEAWREEARRTIEVRYQRAFEGEFIDGESAFERVRERMEKR